MATMTMLPPCCICGDKSSGYHYGANTCEPCKTFFRRSWFRTVPYKCRLNNNCEVISGKKQCSACRLNKCLKNGMSKAASRNGRYTLERKTQNIEVVKKLELQDRITENGSMALASVDREKKLQKMIVNITSVYLERFECRPEFMAYSKRCEEKYVKAKAAKEQMFGQMKLLPRDEYNRVYKSIGIDIDGRKELLIRLMNGVEACIKIMIDMAKRVPGFTVMKLEDQKALLKGSALEVWLFANACYYNVQTGICVVPEESGLAYSMEDMKSFSSNHEDQERFWKLIEKIQRMDLTDEERAIAVALCLMNAEADLSHEGHCIAGASAEYLLEALEYLCSKNHEPEDFVLPKILTTMGNIRTLNNFHQDLLVHFYEDTVDLDIPALYAEFFFSK